MPKSKSVDAVNHVIPAGSTDAKVFANFLRKKSEYDDAKLWYDSAREALLSRFGELCDCDSASKIVVDVVIGSDAEADGVKAAPRDVVRIEPRVSFKVVDFEKLPNEVKDYVKVTEIVSLTTAGKEKFSEYLTELYGAVDYEKSTDYFNDVGMAVTVTKALKVIEQDK